MSVVSGHVAPVDRAAWTPDSQAERCERCDIKFTATIRRHHCRYCGALCCSDCSSGRVCGQRRCAVCEAKESSVKEWALPSLFGVKVLMVLPDTDFDPTESAVMWHALHLAGATTHFATEGGNIPQCDQRMIDGDGFGPFARAVIADGNGRRAYKMMKESPEFRAPKTFAACLESYTNYNALFIPGGHAQGVKQVIEHETVHKLCAAFMEDESRYVGAVCHGVVTLAWSRGKNGESVLQSKWVTALPAFLETKAVKLGKLCLLGNYYETYNDITVQEQVTRELDNESQFSSGPVPGMTLLNGHVRDSPNSLNGFVVIDGHLVTARWPGDMYTMATAFCELLAKDPAVKVPIRPPS